MNDPQIESIRTLLENQVAGLTMSVTVFSDQYEAGEIALALIQEQCDNAIAMRSELVDTLAAFNETYPEPAPEPEL